MAISPASFGRAKRDETGLARTNREIRARTDTRAGTNPPRTVPRAHALTRPRHALEAAVRDLLGLIGRPRNTTGQSTLRCPAQREITNVASGCPRKATCNAVRIRHSGT